MDSSNQRADGGTQIDDFGSDGGDGRVRLQYRELEYDVGTISPEASVEIISDFGTLSPVAVGGAETPSTSTYTLDLVTGINMISLPNRPETPYTAKTFCQKLASASLLIRYDKADQAFKAFIPSQDTDDGFAIQGGEGYIVNLTQDEQVAFTGGLWSDPVVAPVSVAATVVTTVVEPSSFPILFRAPASAPDVWAFVLLGDLPVPLKDRTDLTVRLSYGGGLLEQPLTSRRQIRLSLVDQSRRPVVKAGDKLSLTVVDAADRPVAESVLTIGGKHLSQAFALAEVTYNPIPTFTRLLQNYPNPFNPETWIPFQLQQNAEVSLAIYDVSGQQVRQLAVGHRWAGIHASRQKAIYWDGRSDLGEQVASGLYYYTLTSQSQDQGQPFTATRPLVILK